jgi:dTDP-4-dehydrorhamnose 3,5-epimerase
LKFVETKLQGAFIIDPEKLEDDRGFFARSWCQREAAAYGLVDKVITSR